MNAQYLPSILVFALIAAQGFSPPALARDDGHQNTERLSTPSSPKGGIVGRERDPRTKAIRIVYANGYAQIVSADGEVHADRTPLSRFGQYINKHTNAKTGIVTRIYQDGTVTDQAPNGEEVRRQHNLWKKRSGSR